MVAKRWKACVFGGSGYGGGELIRRLLGHPDVELARVASIDFVGELVGRAHPNLAHVRDLRFERLSAREAATGMDVVLLGLPHKIAASQVPEMLETGARIVDLSGDFRMRNVAGYERYYAAKHPCPELITRFVYGLPELNRDRIRASTCVASPGCFATTIILGLLPLARRGWLRGRVETVGMTGSSGSGVAPQAGTHHPVRSVNLKTYKTLTHQHTPEIVEVLTTAGATGLSLDLVPISAPLSRGLFATSFAHVDASISEQDIHDAYRQFYADEPFVRVPEGRLPEVAAVAGSNFAEVGCVVGELGSGQRASDAGDAGDAGGDETRLVTCISALDNLIKGGAGQAIQSMNLMLGLAETTSLEDPGSWP